MQTITECYQFQVPNAAIMEAANSHCPLWHRYAEKDPPCLTCVTEVQKIAPSIAKGTALMLSALIEPKVPVPPGDTFKEAYTWGRKGAAHDICAIVTGEFG